MLRILAIFGVIVLHYNNKSIGGGLAQVMPGTVNEYCLYAFESATICAVDLFVMISGYFLCKTKKRNIWKIVELLVQVSVFSVSSYLLQTILSGQMPTFAQIKDRLIPSNYFVILYSTTYVISPFVNVALENLSRRQFRDLVLIVFFLFSAYPTMVDIFIKLTGENWNALSSISMYGSQRGYTVVNFILMYVLGAFVRFEEDTISRWSGKSLAAVQFLCVLTISVWAIAEKENIVAWEYCNPLVILSAVVYFLLFLKWDISHNRVINRLAEGTFSVFLMHTFFFPYLKIPRFVNAHPLIMCIHLAFSVCVVYLLCWCVHIVYHLMTDRMFRTLEKRLPLQLLEL